MFVIIVRYGQKQSAMAHCVYNMQLPIRCTFLFVCIVLQNRCHITRDQVKIYCNIILNIRNSAALHTAQ